MTGKLLLACMLAALTTTSASAQTLVRLEGESESWLSPTPFDVRAELIARLHDANIYVTTAPDAPLVTFSYKESSPERDPSGLVPTTVITFEIRVRTANSQTMQTSRIGPVLDDGNQFLSAAELRLKAIDAFQRDQSFVLAGHRVGAALGIEDSMRALATQETPRSMFGKWSVMLSRLSWSPSNDDLCERALLGMRAVDTPLDVRASTDASERFLRVNLAALQNSAGERMQAPLLAIETLGEHGEGSAAKILMELILHPTLGKPALMALQRIEARTSTAVQ